MRTGLPAALLRGTPSAIRDDRFTRCPFPAATTHAPVALARSSNTAMEHRNRCTDLRHPELLATSLLKCPRQDCCETPSETKKIGKLSPLSSFIFLTLRLPQKQGAQAWHRRAPPVGIRDERCSRQSGGHYREAAARSDGHGGYDISRRIHPLLRPGRTQPLA